MKIVAYVLFILQILSAGGHVVNNGFPYLLMVMFGGGIPGFIGFMLPTIIGIILLVIHGKRQNKKNSVSSDQLANDPNAWACAKCGTPNMQHIQTCQKCGVSKAWSDAQKK